jgi:hypothetical protein
MKLGDLLIIRAPSHSYPNSWVRGQDPHRYSVDTPVIYLSEFKEKGNNPRTFYNVLTPTGEHNIFSGYCKELQQ